MKENQDTRNSNIELLRIILMIMVITLHFNNGEMGGAFNLVQAGTLNFHFLYFLESLIMTALIHKSPSLYGYCSIFTFMNAICLFLLFNKLNMQNKVINETFI